MATFDTGLNTAQPAFQQGRNASTAPLTAPMSVPRAQLWQQQNPQAMPGGGGPSPNPVQSPQAGPGQPAPGGNPLPLPGGLPAFGGQPQPNPVQNAAFGGMPPNLANLLQKPQGGPQDGFDPSGVNPSLPANMPSVGAFGSPGGRVLGGTSGFGSNVGPFRSGGGSLGVAGAFGRR